MGKSLKKVKRLNITCFLLLLIEIVSIMFCIGVQLYIKYSMNDNPAVISSINALRIISYALFGIIILISVIHFIKTKKINIINILVIVLAIFPLIFEADKKEELSYNNTDGGNHIVLEKGHDLFGYFIKVDILYIPEWAIDNPDETISKVYCKKEDYDSFEQHQVYNMYFERNGFVKWGVLDFAKEPPGDPWKENPPDRFPPKYTPEDFE